MNNARMNPEEDPRLVEYVLGVLSDEDRAEVEAWIAKDADAQRVVDELRQVATSLEAEMQAEPTVGLHEEQRAAIVEAERGASSVRPLRLWPGLTALAAALFLFACVGWQKGWFEDEQESTGPTVAEHAADGKFEDHPENESGKIDEARRSGEPPTPTPTELSGIEEDPVLNPARVLSPDEEEFTERAMRILPTEEPMQDAHDAFNGRTPLDSPALRADFANNHEETEELDSLELYDSDGQPGYAETPPSSEDYRGPGDTVPPSIHEQRVDDALAALQGYFEGETESETRYQEIEERLRDLDDVEGGLVQFVQNLTVLASDAGGADGYASTGEGEAEVAAVEMLRALGDADVPPEVVEGLVDRLRDAVVVADPDNGEEGREGETQADKIKVNKGTRKTWKRAKATPNASQLMIGDDDGLPLRGLQAQVQIEGFRARVVLDCLYVNDRDQQYEGTFKLRLPNGASPWFFAFGESVAEAPEGVLAGDVFFTAEQAAQRGFAPADLMLDRQSDWKEPKEARMVPKEKAARAYHETVRRRIDPALMEWSGAGVFSARVFPLGPRSINRIVVGYDVDLERADGALNYRLDLPEAEVPVHVDIQVAKVPGVRFAMTPEAESRDGGDFIQYHFEATKERMFALEGEAQGAIVLGGQQEELGDFFAASFVAPVTEEEPVQGARRGVFLVDTSLSSSPDLFNVWADLLPNILAENQDSLEEFAVLFFDISSAWWQPQFVTNDAQGRQAVANAMDQVALEGATDLAAALRRAARPEWAVEDLNEGFDLFLLSDGAATWGESEHLALSKALEGGVAGSLYAYRTGFAGSDIKALEHLVREQGGGVFAVLSEDEVTKAAVAHRQAPWRLDRVEVPGVSDLLISGRPSYIYPGQSLLVAGRGEIESEAPILVHLTRGAQKRTEPITTLAPHPSEVVGRVYGEIAVQHLEAFSELTEETSKAYATQFRVTGKTCSLLMLETEEDYERFEIRPEEDAFVIQRRLVGETIDKALAEFGDTLGDPKRRFLTFLERLGTMPGMSFEAPTSLKLAIEDLPSETFEVIGEPLEIQRRTFEGVPGDLEEMLVVRKIDYDKLIADADRRLRDLSSADALRAISSLVELNPRDPVVLRDVAFSAMEWGLGPTAYHLLRRVADSRPYEPQTYWNLALCLEQMGRVDLAILWYEVALTGEWDSRFGEFRKIVSVDYLRFLRRIASGELETNLSDYVSSRQKTIGEQVSMDEAALVVTLQWNTDRTDVDTHVIEPSGEECYYSHRDTRTGGHLTQDVTQGYGPEMYTLPRQVKGPFRILAHYFASDNNRSGVRSKVYATIYRDWGKETESVERKVLTLERGKQKHEISTVTFK